MTNHYFSAGAFDCFIKDTDFIFADGKGFFKQDVIACVKQKQRSRHMVCVHGTVDNAVCKFAFGGEFGGVMKNHIIGKAVFFLCLFAAENIGVGDTDDFESFGLYD